MLDLVPATDTLARLVVGVRDDQLGAATPCSESNLGDLLDHVNGLSLAFVGAATKTLPPGGSRPPSADGARLGDDWRTRIPRQLADLAAAWRDPGAWQGMTRAGGLQMPGEIVGVVALNEVIVHGWDVAVASGQPFASVPTELLEAAYGFMQATVQRFPNGTPGPFGKPVPIDASAPVQDRLIALSGRDPRWTPPPAAARS
jgi:uncharacterized protein (TIGR03086 family)